ncbi:MAG: type II secretion system minor pseudopilin GspK [Rhodanobacter sp.]|jgi:general secretion pathway protein K|nr:type II secretion system minor pseudopilin GspK [Rhodanobacter sp.]
MIAYRRQRGVALLVALLVVALAVMLIAALLDRGELALARTRNLLRAEQADAYAQGMDIYAATVLVAQVADGPDSHSSPWAMPMPPQEVPGGFISASMRDLNGCFNLNNLSGAYKAPWEAVFARLLTTLGIDPGLKNAIEDWLGTGADEQADRNDYLAQAVPYRPRHGPFAHVSELRLVRGVSGEVYARLAPHVCVLPPGTLINLNTASVPVLQSLAANITQAMAQKAWADGHAQYASVDDFMTMNHLPSSAVPQGLIDVHSTHFLARESITLDGVPFTFYSLIQRGGTAFSGTAVLARSRGSDDALTQAAPVTLPQNPF